MVEALIGGFKGSFALAKAGFKLLGLGQNLGAWFPLFHAGIKLVAFSAQAINLLLLLAALLIKS